MFDNQIIIVLHPETPQETYVRALGKFSHTKFCNSGVEALQFLEQSPAHVAFIESDCDDMSGIEIAEAIRDIDDDFNHFTYICLIGEESIEELTQGAVDTIDHKLSVADPLTTAVAFSAQRISAKVNNLSAINKELQSRNFELQKGQLLEPLTGLGNTRMAEQSLKDSIRQIESRGGAVCVVILAVTNYNETLSRFDQRIADEYIVAVATKLSHLVRPLDIVTHLEDGRFALILVQPTIEHCTAECYQRIYDGISLKTYSTAAGFLSPEIAMSICASHAENGPPSPESLFDGAVDGLYEAAQSQKIIVTHLTPIE